MRNPHLFIQMRRQRQRFRSDLNLSRSQSIRRLQLVPALHSSSAAAASSNLHIEAARHSLQDRLGVGVETVDPTRVAALTDRIAASPDLMDALGPLVGMALRTRREAVKA